MYLTEPPSLKKAQRTRRIAEHYEKVIGGKPATTLEDIGVANAIINSMLHEGVLNENERSCASLSSIDNNANANFNKILYISSNKNSNNHNSKSKL